jgi:hypothetical protein
LSDGFVDLENAGVNVIKTVVQCQQVCLVDPILMGELVKDTALTVEAILDLG